MSNFKNDLNQEHILSAYLDDLYISKKLVFKRVYEKSLQLKGVDVIFTVNGKDYIIDEKAQLHYLNQDLPTFTFELSCLKSDGTLQNGWFLDNTKTTQYYFLITGIELKDNLKTLTNLLDIKALKITSVNKEKLLNHLCKIGLSISKLQEYDIDLRGNKTYGKNFIPELNEKSEGCLFYTQHLSEQPINLQLKLEYLVDNKIAKKFH